MSKLQTIVVDNVPVNIYTKDNQDYICITDMVSAKEGDSRAADVIKNWIRTRTTIEFLGTWESMFNPNFKVVEFDHFRSQAGLPSFVMSVTNWVESTNAVGIFSKSGKNGGTYAHRDIAFEFGSAISPFFKLYLYKEYQRLKEVESNQYNLEWDVRRVMSKVNYSIHTDAVSKYIIPNSTLPVSRQGIEYANEADLLNLALYGYMAKDWKEANPDLVAKGQNMRDYSSIIELLIMSNMESMNAEMIKLGTPKEQRFNLLRKMATEQKEHLSKVDMVKGVRKLNDMTYIDAKDKSGEDLEKEISKSILDVNKQNLLKFNQNIKKGLDFDPKDI